MDADPVTEPVETLPAWQFRAVDLAGPDRSTIQRWLDAYVVAWRSNDPALIADLWTERAVWHRPFDIRCVGRTAITEEWIAEGVRYADSEFDGHYEPIAIDGARVVAHGRTVFYAQGTRVVDTAYDNVWVLTFAPDGRVSEFHEWYAERE